jgi:hypothetical protein
MGLSNLNRSGMTQNRDLPPQENVVIVVNSYTLADKKKASPDDTVTGYLCYSACGIEAEYGPEGQYLTEVTVKLRPDNKQRKKPRREIFDLTRTFGTAPAIKPGGMVVIEGAYFDRRANVISGFWTKALQIDPESKLDMVYPSQIIMCDKERQSRISGGKSYQNVVLADTGNAVAFQDEQGFYEAVKVAINGAPGAKQGFILQIIDSASLERAAETFYAKGRTVNEQFIPETADEAIKRFVEKDGASGSDENFMSYIRSDNPDLVKILIPFLQYGVGTASLPSALKAEGKTVIDPSDRFTRFEKDEQGQPFGRQCFTYGNLHVKRKAEDSDYWYVVHVGTTSDAPILMAPEDIISPAMPEAVHAAIFNDCQARSMDAYRARKEQYRTGGAPASGGAMEPDPNGDAEYGM